jgi:hypothetical protein
MRLVCLSLGLFFLTGCAAGPLLTDVSFNPQTITPNADGLEDVTRIRYHLLF